MLGSFEGMKAVSRSCAKGSQTLLNGSTPFKKKPIDFADPKPIPTFQFTMGLGTTLPLLITTCILPLHGYVTQY